MKYKIMVTCSGDGELENYALYVECDSPEKAKKIMEQIYTIENWRLLQVTH